MATSTSTINFGGLASGLDTNSIVDQLMALERKPQTRLKLKQQQIDTRKSALSDIESRLKNLQLAAQDLKSPTLWLDSQTVDVNDSTKLAATRTGGAGTGGYQVTVTQLAGAYQHWYRYTAPAADETFTAGGRPYSVTAGSDLAAAASAINSDSDATVYASAVTAADGTKYLALSAKKTGSDPSFDFSLAGNAAVFNPDASRDVIGTNAQGKVGAQAFDEPTNTIADMIPGVSLTLKGVTGPASPVTVTVGAPAPDKNAIANKVKAFVDQYNSTVSFIKGKLEEKPIAKPTTTSDALKGVLYGDTALTGLLGQMRIAMTNAFTGGVNPPTLDQMSEIGVSTGKATSGAINQDAVAGKLSFDADAFNAALASDPASVRRLLGGNTTVPGFAQSFDSLLAPMVRADGTLDQAISGQDRQRRAIGDQLSRMDDLLAKKQELLKSQFTAMEKALQGSQSQGQWLSGQLAALNK